jgi:hypothetical protein
MQHSAGLMSFLLPGHEMQEAQNKIQAFRLFAYVDQELRLRENGNESLPELTRRALALTNYRKIWALEGAAHFYTNRVLAKGSPGGMLLDASIPETTMVPMHAGMGTAFAGKVLSRLSRNPSGSELRDGMKRFFELCGANSRPGWNENAIEPMGLAVRSLHPQLLSRVSDALGDINTDSQRLFWHGVGRSLYFVPMNFITYGGSHERALATAISEAPSPEDRKNAVAGLVWAVTLVNICHPDVLRSLLRACEAIRMPGASINGIVSALMIWKQMVPEDREFLPLYLKPGSGSARDVRLWTDYVKSPAVHVFANVFPDLVARGRVASLFQYSELIHE